MPEITKDTLRMLNVLHGTLLERPCSGVVTENEMSAFVNAKLLVQAYLEKKGVINNGCECFEEDSALSEIADN